MRAILTSLLSQIGASFWSYLLTSIFSIAATVALFYFTSLPTTSDEVRKQLLQMAQQRLAVALGRHGPQQSKFNYVLADNFDLSQTKSIFAYGSSEFSGAVSDLYRFWAIYEPSKQTVLDSLTGRPGFYKLVSFGYVESPYPETLLPINVEARDLDGDGIKEVIVGIKSEFADRTSVGILIFKKSDGGSWNFLSIPPILPIVKQAIVHGPTYPSGIHAPMRPFVYFGLAHKNGVAANARDREIPKNMPPANKLVDGGLYDETWTANQDGKPIQFATLGNGGTYVLTRHEIKAYPELETLAFFNDDRAVLSSHYAVVTVFKVEDNALIPDTLWNWGYPMISTVPLDRSQIELDSIMKAGIDAHTSNGIFFGFTEFEKRK